MVRRSKPPFSHALGLFRQRGGALRMSEALRLGVSRKQLYAMRDAGIIDVLSRGTFRLAALEPLGNPDLVTVSARVPHGVMCLISALAFHELTTQVPHAVDVALERGTRKPRLEYPPTHFYWFSGAAFTEGIEDHRIDRVTVRIYSPEKTLADCFRFRNQIGMDVIVESLRRWRSPPEETRRAAEVRPDASRRACNAALPGGARLTEKPIKNLAASVNGRLHNEARATKRPFQELLEGAVLAQALTATCTNRGTAIEVPPLALTADFTEQSATVAQWRAFRKRLAIEQVPETLAEVVAALEPFLLPVARACAAGASFEEHWNPRGPWNAITSR